jgi:hypothetical protein
VIRLPGMHSVKQLNLRGLGGASWQADHFLTRGRGPWPWSHPPSPAGVHKAQTLRSLPEPSSSHSLFHDSFLAFFFRNSTCTLSPSIPQTLAVVVWVRPIDDDDPLPLLRPYSKRPRGCDISTLPIPLAPVLGGLI